MASIVFYEKPGCINNTRQKQMLLEAGHKVDARNLLTENWSRNSLLKYFEKLPVLLWFNSSAPDVKSGKIDPFSLDQNSALALMIENPILIRRPLMRVGDEYRVGFDAGQVGHWIGLADADTQENLETCPRVDRHSCTDATG